MVLQANLNMGMFVDLVEEQPVVTEAKTNGMFADLVTGKEKPIGVVESFQRQGFKKLAGWIPVVGPKDIDKTLYLAAKERFKENRYLGQVDPNDPAIKSIWRRLKKREPFTPEKHKLIMNLTRTAEMDEALIKNYEAKRAEETERGYTIPAAITQGVADLVPWMVDIAIAKGMTPASIKRALPRMITTASIGTGLQLNRVTDRFQDRRIKYPDEGEFTSLLKSYGHSFIENFSELTGEHLVKMGGKLVGPVWQRLPFGKKFVTKLYDTAKKLRLVKSSNDFLKKLSTKAGYDGLLGEIGEERLATIMHAIAGTDDFGAGTDSTILDRLKAGISQDLNPRNMLIETGVLAAPGLIGASAKAIQNRVISKPEVPTGPIGEAEKIATELRLKSHERVEAIEEGELTIDSIKKKALTQIEETKDLRETIAKPAIERLRARQAEAYKEILESELAKGTSAEEAQTKATAGMKDTAGIPEVTPPDFTSAEWDLMFNKNLEIDNDSFRINNTRKALQDWRNGQILQNSQFGYLKDILGKEVTTEMWDKQQKLKPWTALDVVKAAVQIAKSPFAFDVQFVRQASSFAARHPVMYGKNLVSALRSYVSEAYSENLSNQVRANPNHQDAIDSGVNFLSDVPWAEVAGKELGPEQFVIGRPFIEKLAKVGLKKGKAKKALATPLRGFGKWYLASERSMVTSCNSFMQGLWDLQTKQWSKMDIPEDVLETYKKNYADTLNTFMKILRAKTPAGRDIQRAANFVLFSPSMTWSRPRRALVLLRDKGSRTYAASLIATEIGKIYLISAIIRAIGRYLWHRYDWAKDKNGDPLIYSDLNPVSTNWGMLRVGRVSYDLAGGGDIQFYRTIAKLIAGRTKNQAGEVKSVPRLDVLEQYAKSRETALIGIMMELITGRDFQGNKLSAVPEWEKVGQEEGGPLHDFYVKSGKIITKTKAGKIAYTQLRQAFNDIAPQFLASMWQSAIDDGWATMLTRGGIEAMSGATWSAPEGAGTTLTKLRNKLAQEQFGKNWDKLGPQDQERITKQNPELDRLEQQRKYEYGLREQPVEIKPEPIELAENIIKELRILNIPFPNVSRRIGNWYLNDERLEQYKSLAAKNINQRLTAVFNSPGYVKMKDELKSRKILDEINKMKARARKQLKKQANKESRKK